MVTTVREDVQELDAAAFVSPAEPRRLRPAYGFDDVAIVPGVETLHPDDVDLSWQLGGQRFADPVHRLGHGRRRRRRRSRSRSASCGGLGGAEPRRPADALRATRAEPLAEIAAAPRETVTELMQRLYQAPIRDELVARRVAGDQGRRRRRGRLVDARRWPSRLGPIAADGGRRHLRRAVDGHVAPLPLAQRRRRRSTSARFCRTLGVPVVVGNCVGFAAALELMETGIAGLLVGVGPGAACTSREVLGIGVPQVTATLDCAAARDAFYRRTGRYVPIITDGGMRTGGDVCKAFASGADAVMIGSPFAQAAEAPGRGHHWGMATPHAGLPRGTRIKVGVSGTLEQILFGPTSLTNGTQNLVGALRTCMGVCGAAHAAGDARSPRW